MTKAEREEREEDGGGVMRRRGEEEGGGGNVRRRRGGRVGEGGGSKASVSVEACRATVSRASSDKSLHIVAQVLTLDA